ncbi:Dol-P-Man:Man(5)GlcNAc(2)-PP-Dol alpha-1,3-mannosyltransferase [Strongyloides ratti]|uniref:dolichyl-P-Man:Man5GlcNAc2-PP-dolichol alpha-1,3-mannosyltransferase n=1 Tax=Strongyloides ratti TaxID=34506 RepID=A0A090KY18_STRRB|nr:Dol-P-Man:Man(5)GlcNAc(2)-PP-Dol alpha-1,3-mannosyltransferase [Strongyloides ratti]CEF62316.1 Dol-P-Man:Man(5)GlcNAc(2)-PP-Dol alpha-1,3-mannosyltransferase [Strongyloides ratti]
MTGSIKYRGRLTDSYERRMKYFKNDWTCFFDIKRLSQRILNSKDEYIFNFVSKFCLLSELLICFLILTFGKYTEIDWSTYIQQVKIYQSGEYNYTKISGDTGPCVYPAGFLRIFSLLSSLTNNGIDIFRGQQIFAALYLILIFFVHKVFKSTRSLPPIALIIMTFSSYRVHSIFILRLFNDGIGTIFIYLFIYLLLNESYILSLLSFSMALSIKMNALLYLPVLGLILMDKFYFIPAIKYLFIIPGTILLLSYQFILSYPYDYFRQAFDFSRVFLYKWTVNWKFLDENFFLNQNFHKFLLFSHITVLAIFIWKFCLKEQFSFKKKICYITERITRTRVFGFISKIFNTNDGIVFGLLFSNFIGITFARSLHYQFYVWYYHSIPYLIFSGMKNENGEKSIFSLSFIFRCLIILIIEFCWCTFPASFWSSLLLQLCHLSIYGIVIYDRFFC